METEERGFAVGKRQTKHASKAEQTRESLLRAGEATFSERGYHVASVSEICQRAGLANGTFYRYFDNKEEIFVALVERLQVEMRQRIERVTDGVGGSRDTLIRAYRDVLAYVEEHSALYLVGRGAEAMQMGIHRHFRANLAEALQQIIQIGIQTGELRPIDPQVAAYAVLGIIEFTVMRYILWEPDALSESVLQTLDAMILRGFDSGAAPSPPRAAIEASTAPDVVEKVEELHGGEATKQALLAAAERLFGQAGFHRTAISGITYLAGVAQGTFYLHYPSKVAVFVELVREINRRFRVDEQRALAGLEDRRDIERVGFRTFFRFIGLHRGAYRILREAELVDFDTGRWYYERLAKGYVRGLRRGMERGEIRALALEPLAYALLGIGHSVALWALSNGSDGMVTDDTLEGLLDILQHGISFPVASSIGESRRERSTDLPLPDGT